MGPNPGLPHIILVRPTEEGNVGAVARAMANMGLGTLILVEPATALGGTARAFAVGARHVLEGHRRTGSLEEALAPYRRVVGTTSTRDRRIGPTVPLLSPRELPEVLAGDPPGTSTALVFGPEASGLTGEELACMSPLVRVPCSAVQPTLNLAQAVLVIIYELHMARLESRGFPTLEAATELPAAAAQVEGLFAHVRETLAAVGFDRDDTFEAVLRDLRRLAGRVALSSREVSLLRGICRRTLNAVGQMEG